MPFLADLKPSGTYVMEDLHDVGGTPARDEDAARARRARRRLHDGHRQDARREPRASCPELAPGQTVIRAVGRSDQGDRPHPDPARQPRAGRLRREDHRQGGPRLQPAPRACSTREEDMLARARAAARSKGHVIVIRYEGPKGGPGMPEMLTPTSAIMGAGLGDDVALSPTAASPAARTASSSATSRPRRRRAARSRWCATATGSRSTRRRARIDLDVTRRRARAPPRGLDRAAAPGDARHAREVHPQREARVRRLRHGRVTGARSGRLRAPAPSGSCRERTSSMRP